MRGRKKRALILGILCCLLVFMGVGFAVARTTLNIGGTSTAINTWDVRIANITVIASDGVTNNEEETKVSDDGVSANLQADFVKPGDYITYEILVENNGSIDATLDTLDINLLSENVMDKYLFQVDSTFPENAKLEAGASVSFEVTIQYKEEASKLPEGEVKFDIKLNYSQGEGNNEGGSTPETEAEWDFVVNDSGEIIAYNYDLGTDVVIPATNYEGKEIKGVTSKSFQNKNIEYYQDPSTGQVHSVIYEEEPNFSVVKEKAIILFAIETCGSTACVPQIEAVLTMYKAGEYTFPNGVTASFYIDPDPSVEINNSVGSIKRNVTTLDLSNATNLTSIGNDAFNNSVLASVEFGVNSNVTTIGDYAFYSNQISSLTLGDSVTTIGNSAFSSNQISSLTLGDSVTEIGNSAFSSNQISSLTIPNSVTEIGASAFENNQISRLYLPKTVTSLGSSAFSNNPFETIIIEECNVALCKNDFFSGQTNSLIIESGVIGENAFPGNHDPGLKIKKLILGNGVTTIGDRAFSYNQISGELIIPDSVTTIGDDAFRSNQISGELIIPNSVTTIGDSAFYSNQISGELVIPNTVTKIYENTFAYNEISSLIIPDSVTTIGDDAFRSNQISGELIIPDSVTEIGSDAFYGNQINFLVLGKSITNIGNWAFYSQQDDAKNHTLSSILIKRTEEDFLANVTVGDYWYDTSLNPTIIYDPS